MAVTFTSHGYDTTTGNPYTEIAWADAHPLIGSGTYGVRSGSDWAVTAVTGADRTVSIEPGFGWGSGVTDQTVANETIQLDTVTSGSRWDLIVARRDWTPTAGETKFMKINGGSTKAIPGGRLMTPGGIDDQPLALVQVTAGQTQPTAIVDLRCWANNGGMVAKDELVKGYLNKLGTELYIGGVQWRYVPGANDVPEWVSSDTTQAAADITTFGTGFTPLTGGHKPRVRRNGNMVHLVGAVQRTTGDFGNILTVPAAFRGAAGVTVFVGSGVSSNGIAYQLVLANGILSLPTGYATNSDTGPNTVFPVTASWPIS
jgi:hypothetical protein